MESRQPRKTEREFITTGAQLRPTATVLHQPQSDVRHYQNSPTNLGDAPPSVLGKSMLFYVVDWLPPDFGAVGQYAVIFAREIAQSGREVCLIGLTSGANDTGREQLASGGVLEVKRLSAKRYNKSGLVSRLIWSLRTNLRLIFEVIQDPRSRGAEILFTGAPPFMLFFAIFAKWFRGARLIYRITDFYPEVLIAALGRKPLLLAFFEQITWILRKQVNTIQVLGEDQRQLLLARGIAPERIVLKRDVPPVPISGREKPAPHPVELAGLKVLLYSGNYGVAHEVDTVVEGLIRHHRQGSRRFGLWLNASGSSVETVTRRLRTAGIPFAVTEPVPLDQLPPLLVAPDAHLITLRPGFSGLVVPSKLYGCLHSGRPILFVGPRSSDVHLLCMQAKSTIYEHVEPANVPGFAEALERLAPAAQRMEAIESIMRN
jgi:hypothetical protein